MERKNSNPQQTEEEDNNHNPHFSNPTANLHPSHYTSWPIQSHPLSPQYAGSSQPFLIPRNFVVPSSHQGSVSHIRYPYQFKNTPIQIQPISSNGVHAHQFHNPGNWSYVNGYPFYMPAGITPLFYQQPMQNFRVQSIPRRIGTGQFHSTSSRPAQNCARQSRSQTNYNNVILAPRPRPAQNHARQFLSQTNGNNDIFVPRLHGSDHLSYRAHERTYRPDPRFYKQRSQNRNRELVHYPEYIERDHRLDDEQPCEEVGHSCQICKEDLLVDSIRDLSIDPMNHSNRFHPHNLTETAVLPCQHAFHMSCFQLYTNPGEDLVEPPCPSCSPSTSQTLAEYKGKGKIRIVI